MNRQKVWKVVGAILLVYGLQLHGQRAACGADAAATAGTLTTFDVPGSACQPRFAHCTVATNPEGAITGFYADTHGSFHSFLRAANGIFTKFDPLGATCTDMFSKCSRPGHASERTFPSHIKHVKQSASESFGLTTPV